MPNTTIWLWACYPFFVFLISFFKDTQLCEMEETEVRSKGRGKRETRHPKEDYSWGGKNVDSPKRETETEIVKSNL